MSDTRVKIELDPRYAGHRETFGAVLRELRDERGLSLSEVAFRCGITKQGYLRIERGNNPSAVTLVRLARALHVDFVVGPTGIRLGRKRPWLDET